MAAPSKIPQSDSQKAPGVGQGMPDIAQGPREASEGSQPSVTEGSQGKFECGPDPAKARAGLEAARRSINVTELPRDRRQPGQIASRKDAIRWFCRECNGFDPGDSGSLAQAVRECPAVQCPLWPWRNGGLDKKAKEV